MRASFSSYGPTYDGRTKPDLVALGATVRVASTTNDTLYTSSSGSSFSTPITAGACALLLQADPALTPMQVHAFLKASADQAGNPDTLRGWGIYDVWAAIQSVLAPVTEPGTAWQPADFKVFPPFPNPFNNRVNITFLLPRAGDVKINIYSTAGKLIKSHRGWYYGGYNSYQQDFASLSSGIYLCRLAAGRREATTKILYLK
jgi:subtilisin family serine protease